MRVLANALRISALVAAIGWLGLAIFAIARPRFHGVFGIWTFNVETPDVTGMGLWMRVFALLLPAIAFAYAMIQLAGLLRLAARNEVFTAPAATYLRRFGVWLLVTTLAGKLAPLIAQVLSMWWTHAEHGQVEISMTQADVWNIFVSALFMLVARVLADAYRIAEENRQII